MKNTYKQILSLYLYNRSFLILLGIFLVSALLSKLLYHLGYLYYAQEVFTMLFVVSLWGAFHLGMMIKRQFANHRASLLPNYRVLHIKVLGILYLVLIFIGYLWEFGLRPVIEVSPNGLWGIYFTCLLIALLITYLGYLSIGRILIYAYMILLVFSNQAMNFIGVLNSSSYLVYVKAVAWIFFVGFLINRLSHLKEDDFEYNHLFSWPPKSLIVNQMQASQSVTNFLRPLSNIFKIKKKVVIIPKYHQETNILARAYHWDYTEHTDLKVIWILMLLAAPLFLMLMNKQPALESFSKNVYSNFLLLSMSPVLITIGANYRRIAYWGYDVLKPVGKKQYMKQQGIVLLTSLFLYWALIAVFFAILPNIIAQPDLFMAKKFWAYLFLTLIFAFSVLSWLALLSCVKSSTSVIMQGVVLSVVVLWCFYFVSGFSLGQILLSNLISLIGSIVLCRKAYEVWCENEFDNK